MQRGGREKTNIILINTFEVLDYVPIWQIRHDRTFHSFLPRLNLTDASQWLDLNAEDYQIYRVADRNKKTTRQQQQQK